MEVSIFPSINDAIRSVKNAYERYAELSLEDREDIIDGIRHRLEEQADVIALLAVKETGMGCVVDKKKKLFAAIRRTPALEDLITEVKTGDRGMTLYELSAFGIVCAMEPLENPAASLISHVIGMLAAGNAVFICPHPRAIRTSNYVTSLISRAIVEICGIDNLVVSLDESNIAMTEEVIHHPDIDMIVCGADESLLRKAMTGGKKVIGEGCANTVTLVDETADIGKAARDIALSASFDHNLMHSSEKSVLAVDSIADLLENEFERNGTRVIRDRAEMDEILSLLFAEDGSFRRKWIGRSAEEILAGAGIRAEKGTRLILLESDDEAPLVTKELKIPVLGLVRVENYEEGLQKMLEIEQRYRHTASIHSTCIDRLNEAAKKLQTGVFIKNGPALSAIGVTGMKGPCSMMVANTTGEGAVSARHFARRRKCMMTNGFSIR
ncbi:aldehyde dehydrogenase [[Clostridium] aminophilum]|uniref:aldehyde dehydrogenase n=1 Tax=[Clostridium] aminophilum TaxID=1526 RepID=UPI003F9AB790